MRLPDFGLPALVRPVQNALASMWTRISVPDVNRSLETLAASPTRTRTRPLVLLLQYGYSRVWFERILPATRIHRTDDEFEPGEALALHTITSCELGGDELKVESTAVLGPAAVAAAL